MVSSSFFPTTLPILHQTPNSPNSSKNKKHNLKEEEEKIMYNNPTIYWRKKKKEGKWNKKFVDENLSKQIKISFFFLFFWIELKNERE